MDGWGRWTRRRKWYRDAELVEVDEDETTGREAGTVTDTTPLHQQQLPLPPPSTSPSTIRPNTPGTINDHNPGRQEPAITIGTETDTKGVDVPYKDVDKDADGMSVSVGDSSSIMSTSSRSFFRPNSVRRRVTGTTSDRARRDSEAKSEQEAAALGLQVELGIQGSGKQGEWGIGDDARMCLE